MHLTRTINRLATKKSAHFQQLSLGWSDGHTQPDGSRCASGVVEPIKNFLEGLSLPSSCLVFRHPNAAHELSLGEVLIAYELKRVRRRSIGMIISLEGLTVRAPRWVSLQEIDQTLAIKAHWILTKLIEQQERKRQQARARINWHHGAQLPFLGEPLRLSLSTHSMGIVFEPKGACSHCSASHLPSAVLNVGLPAGACVEQIRASVQTWLQGQARQLFEQRCREFATRLGVSYREIKLSSAQTRWGSASADGCIRLNWRLIHLSMAMIDYVVAHELAHLREMNHSPRFWALVGSVIPDLRQTRHQLKNQVLPQYD